MAVGASAANDDDVLENSHKNITQRIARDKHEKVG